MEVIQGNSKLEKWQDSANTEQKKYTVFLDCFKIDLAYIYGA